MAVKRGLKSIKALVVGEAAPTNPGQPGQRSVLAQKAMTPDLYADDRASAWRRSVAQER